MSEIKLDASTLSEPGNMHGWKNKELRCIWAYSIKDDYYFCRFDSVIDSIEYHVSYGDIPCNTDFSVWSREKSSEVIEKMKSLAKLEKQNV